MNPDNTVPSAPAGLNVQQNPGQPPAGSAPVAPPQFNAPPAGTPWLEPTVPVHPTAAPGAATAAPASDPQLYVVTPAVADDGDVIEKEWVMAAKQIVERTRTDPHEQVKQMHAFRAEYMKKRYNKTIKPVEE